MAEGIARAEIVREARAQLGMAPRTVDDYIRKVRDSWTEQARETRADRRAAARARLVLLRRKMMQSKAWNAVIGIERLLVDLDGLRQVSEEDFEVPEVRPMPPPPESLEEALDVSIGCIDTTVMMVDQMLPRQKEQLRKACEQALDDIENGGALARMRREAS